MQSIRFKLTLLFLVTIVLPVVIIVIILPSHYYKLVTDQRKLQMEDTLTALTFSIGTYLDELERMTITPYLNDDVMWALKLKSTERSRAMNEYEEFLAEQALSITLPKFLKNTRREILGTILLPRDGSVYSTSSSGYEKRTIEGYMFEQQEWYRDALEANGKTAFSSVHVQSYFQDAGSEVFSVSRLIKDPDSGYPLGVIMAAADAAILERIMSGIRLKDRAIAAILDDKWNMIYTSRALSDNILQQLASGNALIQDEQEHYSIVSETMMRSNWHIVVLFPESVVRKQLQDIYWVGVGFAVLGLLIAVLLFFTISRWIVTPFKQMIQVMKQVQRGDLQSFYQVKGNDEIAGLGKSLNRMISRLNELIDREFRAVLNHRNAEFRALQSQIQPHFLYNTLNGFIGLNRTGQSKLLERSILSLSGMMRYTLENNDTVRLEDELEFVQRYCELQKMRFAEKLDFQIKLKLETEGLMVPKLLLQPLVENAIIHGIEPSSTPCLLIIEAKEIIEIHDMKPWLEICISDDGAGFDVGRVKEGVGMINVRERLQLFDKEAVLSIESTIGEGTIIRIQLPAKDVIQS